MPIGRPGKDKVRQPPETGYQETPATALDVVHEMREQAFMVAAIVNEAPDRDEAYRRMMDASTDQGQALVAQELVVTIAMESWLGEMGTEFVADVVGELEPALVDLRKRR